MVTSEGVRGQVEREARSDDDFQALREEVLSLRLSRKQQSETESSLIQELQRRCNRIIELEVKLDEERERANRLERARVEEDEALSGELRDIMANVGTFPPTATDDTGATDDPIVTGTTPLPNASCNSFSAAGSAESGAATAVTADINRSDKCEKRFSEKNSNEKVDAHDAKTDGDGRVSPVRAEKVKATAAAAVAAAAAGVGRPLGAASELFAEWGLGRGREGAAQAQPVLSPERRNGTDSGSGSGGGGGEIRHHELGFDKSPPELTAEGSGEGTGGGSSAKGKGGSGSGPLRARVVELELQRAEAADMFKEKADRCIRLEVQVEQLKNVVQSLSHSSTSIETQWLGEGSKTSVTASGTLDFSPLLRGVPDVDPSVLLLLHRTPWAEGVIEGVRKEETCFEWQSLGSRGEWSSKPSSFPAELSSLPYLTEGPPPPPPPTPPQYLARTSPPRDGNASSHTSPRSTAADPNPSGNAVGKLPSLGSSNSSEASRDAGGQQQQQAGKGTLREKIGGVVSAFGTERGWGGTSPDAQAVTDEGVTCRFNLGSVGLPSDHWEWVGGWMIDSEAEASADPEGWVYGRTTTEISDIATGRSRPSSVDDLERAAAKSGSSGSALSFAGCGGVSGGVGSGNREGPGLASMVGPRNHAAAAAAAVGRVPHAGVPGGDAEGPVHPTSTRAAEGGAYERAGGGGGVLGKAAGAGGAGGGAVLRRRRLARLRMVTSVDGARESTRKFLEMMRRLCSLEILVRKLSRQVVTLHRQVTGMEGQVAFLAPLQPKLRQACKLGRMDRQRGDAFQKKLIEAENELKVLRRCIDSTASTTSGPAPTPNKFPATLAEARQASAATGAPPGRKAAPGSVPPAGGSGSGSGGGGGGDQRSDAQSVREDSRAPGGGDAWGWVGGLAHRAAGGLTRRPPPPSKPPAPGFGEEKPAGGNCDAGLGDSGATV